MNTKHIISGIHNYCDRWCERCSFIDRCSLGVIEQKRWAKGADWSEFVLEDGLLITGQNPASSEKAAQLLIEKMALQPA